MKTIVVPTDFSVPSVNALHYAIHIAKTTRSKVLVCHIYQVALGFTGDPEMADTEFRQEAQQEMENFLAEIDRETQEAVGLKAILLEGNIVGELCRLIEEQKVALVVMGTTGGNNMLKSLFGTTTETIIKDSCCPVLAIPAGVSFAPIEQIVYASDFENNEELPMLQLLQVKEILKASLSVLHVKSKEQPDLVNDDEIKANLVKRYPAEEFNFIQVDNNDVAAGLEQYVREHPTTLLAFTILPRTWWESLFHNSVTSRLIKNLNLPMLALPKIGRLLDLRNHPAAIPDVADKSKEA